MSTPAALATPPTCVAAAFAAATFAAAAFAAAAAAAFAAAAFAAAFAAAAADGAHMGPALPRGNFEKFCGLRAPLLGQQQGLHGPVVQRPATQTAQRCIRGLRRLRPSPCHGCVGRKRGAM